MVCEPFTQWVLEDDFADGRPPLEDAGVQLVDDVDPYELMKLRLLNASHQALCYLGYLAGYRLRARGGSGPAVPPVPDRLHGPRRPRRRCSRCRGSTSTPTSASSSSGSPTRTCATPWPGCARTPPTASRKFLLPVLRANLAHGGPIRCAVAVVAAWARYAEGIDEPGAPIEIVDRAASS